jgi:hypothetical protein
LRSQILLLLALLSAFTFPLTGAATEENNVEVFNCSILIRDHYLRRRNPILLEIKDREVQIPRSASRADLHTIFSNEELSPVVRGTLQAMGTVFKKRNQWKLNLGFYRLHQTDSRFVTRENYWIAPEGAPYYGRYAHPIVESMVRFKPSKSYEVDLKSSPMSTVSFGTYEPANQVRMSCTHVQSL